MVLSNCLLKFTRIKPQSDLIRKSSFEFSTLPSMRQSFLNLERSLKNPRASSAAARRNDDGQFCVTVSYNVPKEPTKRLWEKSKWQSRNGGIMNCAIAQWRNFIEVKGRPPPVEDHSDHDHRDQIARWCVNDHRGQMVSNRSRRKRSASRGIRWITAATEERRNHWHRMQSGDKAYSGAFALTCPEYSRANRVQTSIELRAYALRRSTASSAAVINIHSHVLWAWRGVWFALED